ncbi:MAG: carbohydrate kinase family protein [Pseudomonadota bacterium]
MSDRPHKAVTVGSATIDIIAFIANADIEQMRLTNQTASFLLMEPGRKVDAENIKTYFGGGGVNAAISLKRQGFETAALVKLGTCVNGQSIEAELARQGIDGYLVRHDPAHATAVSLLIASHDRDAAIFTHRGANEYLNAEDIAGDPFKGADLVYIAGLSNASADLFPEIVRQARAAGAFVATNPGIRQLTSKTRAFFDSLSNVDLFICNRVEARALIPKLVERTGWDAERALELSPGEPVLEIEGFRLPYADYFRRMHSLGPRFVGITDGSDGAYVSDAGEIHFQAVVPANVQGTTGAGDSFASTLAGALGRGETVANALLLAAYNAASVVSHPDAHAGLLTSPELIRAADNHR